MGWGGWSPIAALAFRSDECVDRDVIDRADDLAAMTVLDEQGQVVTVGTLWRDRTAVLVFVRHFG